jgi:hypothetical protein
MFLLFLCLGTILAPSCWMSCQGTFSLSPSSGSIRAASSHPFSCSTTAPTPSCAAGPAPSPYELGPRTRSSASAASRLAWPRTPRLAARLAAADCRVCTQAVLPQPSGSHFQTCWFLHLPLPCRMRWSQNRLPTRRGGFCTPGTGGALTGATDTVPVSSTGLPQRLDL